MLQREKYEEEEKKSAAELKVSLGKFFGIRLFEKLASALPRKRNPELLAKARDWVFPMRFGRSVASRSAVFDFGTAKFWFTGKNMRKPKKVRSWTPVKFECLPRARAFGFADAIRVRRRFVFYSF